ncbi:hypothetical protein BO71DRAFT_427983 [Aspergillus ellipticus CBS 707.79]|uniref:Zn(2)-C6 fungal-type domain-containing protein n=1 Tax=Aspergillus ellipticus CBS 707.79 TaxID=1448320 RepID=A0A319DGI4_9EURO|nr:hypothetical protein BO71DRAFT_427983 [Aspergillus ellipticus CBS 707.79]
MKNIRMDSLPPNRQIALQDCRTCAKRRIKCDRSVPHCRKCTIRGLTCPGFDQVQLKWIDGVTSRGKLAGRTLSLQCQEIDTKIRANGFPTICKFSTDSLAIDGASSISDPTVDCGLVHRHSSVALSSRLINHFHMEVAPLLTWIDSPDNAWRKVVLPLAQRSPCLRLGILNIAAAHFCITSSSGNPESAAKQVHQNLRHTAICALNAEIQRELEYSTMSTMTREVNTLEHSSLMAILASALSLCFGELFIPESNDWKIHLGACRNLMDRYNVFSWKSQSLDAVCRFLVKEVNDLGVFGNVSSFARHSLSPTHSTVEFQLWKFTDLIQEITFVERQRYESMKEGFIPPDVDMGAWQDKLEQAYAQISSLAIRNLPSHDEPTQKRFEALIRAHYHAIRIYIYQAHAPHMVAAKSISASLKILAHEVQSLATGPTHLFSHGLFFPLFIAGTESWADEHGQDIFSRLFLGLLYSTGVWCNYAALQFLRVFWARPESHGTGRWIQFARENESKIGTFLVM